ncbi:hypothetical protein F7U66_00330 [Vibrio parahaemolyticus]|nr:hypothetical protein [Vibrio parahaemolyticus]
MATITLSKAFSSTDLQDLDSVQKRYRSYFLGVDDLPRTKSQDSMITHLNETTDNLIDSVVLAPTSYFVWNDLSLDYKYPKESDNLPLNLVHTLSRIKTLVIAYLTTDSVHYKSEKIKQIILNSISYTESFVLDEDGELNFDDSGYEWAIDRKIADIGFLMKDHLPISTLERFRIYARTFNYSPPQEDEPILDQVGFTHSLFTAALLTSKPEILEVVKDNIENITQNFSGYLKVGNDISCELSATESVAVMMASLEDTRYSISNEAKDLFYGELERSYNLNNELPINSVRNLHCSRYPPYSRHLKTLLGVLVATAPQHLKEEWKLESIDIVTSHEGILFTKLVGAAQKTESLPNLSK